MKSDSSPPRGFFLFLVDGCSCLYGDFFLNCFAKSVFLVAYSHRSFCCFIYVIGCVLTEISLNIWAQGMGSGVCILKSSSGCYWENHCSLRGQEKAVWVHQTGQDAKPQIFGQCCSCHPGMSQALLEIGPLFCKLWQSRGMGIIAGLQHAALLTRFSSLFHQALNWLL